MRYREQGGWTGERERAVDVVLLDDAGALPPPALTNERAVAGVAAL